jgi:hypothetical protein
MADVGLHMAHNVSGIYNSAMWWRRRNHPEAVAAGSDDQLRAQLTEASANLRRQIEVQNFVRYSRCGDYGGDDPMLPRHISF